MSNPNDITIEAAFRLSIIKRHLSQSAANAQINKHYEYTLDNGILTAEQRYFLIKFNFK